MKHEDVVNLLDECIEHLEYCNYGDSWERECAEELREKIERYTEDRDDYC